MANAYDGSKDHANAHCWDSVSFWILVLLLAVKDASVHTGEDSPCLLDVEAMICLKNHRDRAELQVKNSPAKRDPDGKGKDNRLGEEHIYVLLEAINATSGKKNLRNGR